LTSLLSVKSALPFINTINQNIKFCGLLKKNRRFDFKLPAGNSHANF